MTGKEVSGEMAGSPWLDPKRVRFWAIVLVVVYTLVGFLGLPPLIEAVRASGRRVVWSCDPMHGNTRTTPAGVKTRSFDAILKDLESTIDAHAAAGTILGGVHFELTGEDVTECTGGAAGLTDEELSGNYASLCDPRLNYQQSLELAFLLARRLSNGRD